MLAPDPLLDELLATDLGRIRLLLLEGTSGSGKSTRLRELLARHPQLAGRARTEIDGAPVHAGALRPATRIVLVDEIRGLGELPGLLRLVARGHQVLCATHAPTAWLGRLPGILHRRTDADATALSHWLAARRVAASPAAIEQFRSAHGASFTFAALALEATDCDDLDVALRRLRRRVRVDVRSHDRPVTMTTVPAS